MLEDLIGEQVKVEKEGTLDDGEVIYERQYTVDNNLRQYNVLTRKLSRSFRQEFPQLASRMEDAVFESLKNYLEKADPADPGQLIVGVYATEEDVLVKVTGTAATPHGIGYKTPEERGFDPAHPDNDAWKNNGRDGKFSWGTMIIMARADIYRRTLDGKSEYLAFKRERMELTAARAS